MDEAHIWMERVEGGARRWMKHIDGWNAKVRMRYYHRHSFEDVSNDANLPSYNKTRVVLGSTVHSTQRRADQVVVESKQRHSRTEAGIN